MNKNKKKVIATNAANIEAIVAGLNEVARRFQIIVRGLPDNAPVHESHPSVQTMFEVKACFDATMRALDATEGKSIMQNMDGETRLRAFQEHRLRRRPR